MKLDVYVEQVSKMIAENSEQLLRAWMAQTGLLPSESVVVMVYTDGGFRIWIERKPTQ